MDDFVRFSGPALAQPDERLIREVRQELVMLPYCRVFDNLAYGVEGDRVPVFGQLVKPTLKFDAGIVVMRIAGVEVVERRPSAYDSGSNLDQRTGKIIGYPYGTINNMSFQERE